ncbi:hypothetical protein L484_000379 [Morus notabilis]|uniref:Uncharacterized protein n=1 Tax=Morus notabilis TaxID=981085 RepID=W9SPY1_9ROSA|nr:hypothetical protein L484_000379 [Morus notabilis]
MKARTEAKIEKWDIVRSELLEVCLGVLNIWWRDLVLLIISVSYEQTAFVSNEIITNNIIVAFKVLNSIRRKTGGREGLMALKLDMGKAMIGLNGPF